MRIVIDMQGAQTLNDCGAGRYCISFAKAVVRNCGKHEIVLVLSSFAPDTVEPIRAAFEGLLPQENIRVWYAPTPLCESDQVNRRRCETAELLREAFLASLNPDVVHIISPFEGYGEDVVVSIGRLEAYTVPTSVTLYDRSSLLNTGENTAESAFVPGNVQKMAWVNNAQLLFSTSEFSRQDIIERFGFDADRVVNIYTAIRPEFKILQLNDVTQTSLRNKFGLNRAFVFYNYDIAEQKKHITCLIDIWAAMPTALREQHQLLVTGKIPDTDVAKLLSIAGKSGLQANELIIAGDVTDDELVQLCNLCKLIIFPSEPECFKVSPLEAMAFCEPVICADTASIAEVIAFPAALFDPVDDASFARKLVQALQDDGFLAELRTACAKQVKKYSWDESALHAINAWELFSEKVSKRGTVSFGKGKPRLALVSPMPPERTGVADYSAELLPALAEYYEVDLVVAQQQVADPWVDRHCKIRDAAWLRANAKHVDRVLYHMGNSPFHQYMLPLLEEIPGTVVLHDFYLGHLKAWLEHEAGVPNAWTEELYNSHGYAAVRSRFQDSERTLQRFPVNGFIQQYARGVIVHSNYSRDQALQWYGGEWGSEWRVIPLLRKLSEGVDRVSARKQLGIADDDFVVCSFGFLTPLKLNDRLLNAWIKALAHDRHCHLAFVGDNHKGDYGAGLLKTIQDSQCKDRIRITGFASPELFKKYLVAADVAVQLRTSSRGETSAAILDCMNHGLPTIVNAHGTAVELDRETVWMLPDEFDDEELASALASLRASPEKCVSLGKRAKEHIHAYHGPAACARQYADAIEAFYADSFGGISSVIRQLARQSRTTAADGELVSLATALSCNHPLPRAGKRFYLDITGTYHNDLKTGIERVARALVMAFLESPPDGYYVEPVYLSLENDVWRHRHARRYTLGLLDCPTDIFVDDLVEPEVGDVLLTLDLSGDMLIRAQQSGLFKGYRNRGVAVYATVYDLLPVSMPQVFPPDADRNHRRWLEAISSFDGAVCDSKAVADELRAWQKSEVDTPTIRRDFSIAWIHLGADLGSSAPTVGLPMDAADTLKQIEARPTFLMVSTVEPRKGYLQSIDTFTTLWDKGIDVNLVIVGREGWRGIPDDLRRDIPETLTRIRSHHELNKHLFWLEGISDEYLEKVYAASTCLIAASYGEGFGLPLIEAAQKQLPIMARDIPVFREVAGEYAFYFDADSSEQLAKAVQAWLELYNKKKHPQSSNMPWRTWKQSAENMGDVLLNYKKMCESPRNP